MAKLRFNVSTGRLTITEDSGTIYSVSATSGRDDCMNNLKCETIAKRGPLPRGYYRIITNEINNPSALGDIARNLVLGDWGDWRVPLHPQFSSGRSGFFIHGGRKQGSAGCIDIGGGILGSVNTDRVLASLQKSQESELWVE